MSNILLISVRLHEGWYHGSSGPPSPARIFQALVAGAGLSGPLDKKTVESLEWLECQNPPIVGSPHATSQKAYVNYVPNNDLDAKQGDYRRIGEIRTKKVIAPLVFDPTIPFLFAWNLAGDAAVEAARTVVLLADRVYQLGRTIDMAWAWAELLSDEELIDRLNDYLGIVRRPSAGTGDVDCPTPGSLDSLCRRYNSASERFDRTSDGKGQTFRRRSKPKWKKVGYAGMPSRFVLELRRADNSGFAPWPLERASALVESVRDRAVERLRSALKDRSPEIDRVLIGRKPNGANSGRTSTRVRIVPLPSIGHPQADMQIRRISVEVPAECPIRADDIAWALSGLRLDHPVSGEVIDLIASDDQVQLGYYGVGKPARIWQSVTPTALTEAARRRIDPKEKDSDAKSGSEKRVEHYQASFAVAQALRHAGIGPRLSSVRVQREPFDLRGTRVEPFAEGTRFSKHTLWHVQLEFEAPISGPLLIGDGRFLGLGLLRPVQCNQGIYTLTIDSGLVATAKPVDVTRALRRAVMARVQAVHGERRRLPAFFTGHERDGAPAMAHEHPHLTFLFDQKTARVLIVAPHVVERRPPTRTEEQYLAILEQALQNFFELRAGAAGRLILNTASNEFGTDAILAQSRVWESITDYRVTRHTKNVGAAEALTVDIQRECLRRGLPTPHVTPLKTSGLKNVGLNGRARLKFKVAVDGPIVLGKDRHFGGGLFAATDDL